ncbi:MAG: DUF2520 domain-containing protein [Agathobacter sp.]|nr:DUF2520 domain-containing protein [Agathobacter sp.]
MKTGIIGAGRVGCSLGKYLSSKGVELAGYYDTDFAAAKEAAEFTQTDFFETLQSLVDTSELLFITTGDSYIVPVWEEVKKLSHKNQIICHCSGALSSDSFSGAEEAGVSCCSVHPMLPFSNKFSSYQQLEHAFFTVEGQEYAVNTITKLLTSFGNQVCRINAEAKPKYHAAASILSNQVIAVLDTGYRLLEECGFTRAEAVSATAALVRSNIENVIAQDCAGALTGPIERGDTGTVEKHLACLDSDEETKTLYQVLGKHLVTIAQEKNPNRDYTQMQILFKIVPIQNPLE